MVQETYNPSITLLLIEIPYLGTQRTQCLQQYQFVFTLVTALSWLLLPVELPASGGVRLVVPQWLPASGRASGGATPVPSGTLLHAKRGGRNQFLCRLIFTDMHTKFKRNLVVLRTAVALELGN